MDRSPPFAAFSDVYPERGHSRQSGSERDSVEFDRRPKAAQRRFAPISQTFELPIELSNSGYSNLQSAELINVAFKPVERYRCPYERCQSHRPSCSSRLLELRC